MHAVTAYIQDSYRKLFLDYTLSIIPFCQLMVAIFHLIRWNSSLPSLKCLQ